MNSKVYKWCAVPQCKNTSIKTPEKVFVYVPNKKLIREKWLKLARRNPNDVVTNSSLYFCEDHFDLPNDMENYMEYHVMGSVSQVRMKPGCMPKKFICQPDRKTRTADATERPYIAKKQRTMILEECVNKIEEKRILIEPSSPEEIASGSSEKAKNMEVKRKYIRECSVRLWRCDHDSSRSPARPEGGVLSASHESPAPASSQATGHIQECTEEPVTVKIEYDVEDTYTNQETRTGLAPLGENLVNDICWFIKEEDDLVIKTEGETNEVVFKEELEVGPTVLQPPPAPRVQQPDLDPRPGTSSGGDGVPVALYHDPDTEK